MSINQVVAKASRFVQPYARDIARGASAIVSDMTQHAVSSASNALSNAVNNVSKQAVASIAENLSNPAKLERVVEGFEGIEDHHEDFVSVENLDNAPMPGQSYAKLNISAEAIEMIISEIEKTLEDVLEIVNDDSKSVAEAKMAMDFMSVKDKISGILITQQEAINTQRKLINLMRAAFPQLDTSEVTGINDDLRVIMNQLNRIEGVSEVGYGTSDVKDKVRYNINLLNAILQKVKGVLRGFVGRSKTMSLLESDVKAATLEAIKSLIPTLKGNTRETDLLNRLRDLILRKSFTTNIPVQGIALVGGGRDEPEKDLSKLRAVMELEPKYEYSILDVKASSIPDELGIELEEADTQILAGAELENIISALDKLSGVGRNNIAKQLAERRPDRETLNIMEIRLSNLKRELDKLPVKFTETSNRLKEVLELSNDYHNGPRESTLRGFAATESMTNFALAASSYTPIGLKTFKKYEFEDLANRFTQISQSARFTNALSTVRDELNNENIAEYNTLLSEERTRLHKNIDTFYNDLSPAPSTDIARVAKTTLMANKRDAAKGLIDAAVAIEGLLVEMTKKFAANPKAIIDGAISRLSDLPFINTPYSKNQIGAQVGKLFEFFNVMTSAALPDSQRKDHSMLETENSAGIDDNQLNREYIQFIKEHKIGAQVEEYYEKIKGVKTGRVDILVDIRYIHAFLALMAPSWGSPDILYRDVTPFEVVANESYYRWAKVTNKYTNAEILFMLESGSIRREEKRDDDGRFVKDANGNPIWERDLEDEFYEKVENVGKIKEEKRVRYSDNVNQKRYDEVFEMVSMAFSNATANKIATAIARCANGEQLATYMYEKSFTRDEILIAVVAAQYSPTPGFHPTPFVLTREEQEPGGGRLVKLFRNFRLSNDYSGADDKAGYMKITVFPNGDDEFNDSQFYGTIDRDSINGYAKYARFGVRKDILNEEQMSSYIGTRRIARHNGLHERVDPKLITNLDLDRSMFDEANRVGYPEYLTKTYSVKGLKILSPTEYDVPLHLMTPKNIQILMSLLSEASGAYMGLENIFLVFYNILGDEQIKTSESIVRALRVYQALSFIRIDKNANTLYMPFADEHKTDLSMMFSPMNASALEDDLDAFYHMIVKSAVCRVIAALQGISIQIGIDPGRFNAYKVLLGGGSMDAIRPELTELYIRLPLFVEFWKSIQKEEDKSGKNTVLLLSSGMGPWTRVINELYNIADGSGDYSESRLHDIVSEINSAVDTITKGSPVKNSTLIESFYNQLSKHIVFSARNSIFQEELTSTFNDMAALGTAENPFGPLDIVGRAYSHALGKQKMSFTDTSPNYDFIGKIKRKFENTIGSETDSEARIKSIHFNNVLDSFKERIASASDKYSVLKELFNVLGGYGSVDIEKNILFHESILFPMTASTQLMTVGHRYMATMKTLLNPPDNIGKVENLRNILAFLLELNSTKMFKVHVHNRVIEIEAMPLISACSSLISDIRNAGNAFANLGDKKASMEDTIIAKFNPLVKTFNTLDKDLKDFAKIVKSKLGAVVYSNHKDLLGAMDELVNYHYLDINKNAQGMSMNEFPFSAIGMSTMDGFPVLAAPSKEPVSRMATDIPKKYDPVHGNYLPFNNEYFNVIGATLIGDNEWGVGGMTMKFSVKPDNTAYGSKMNLVTAFNSTIHQFMYDVIYNTQNIESEPVSITPVETEPLIADLVSNNVIPNIIVNRYDVNAVEQAKLEEAIDSEVRSRRAKVIAGQPQFDEYVGQPSYYKPRYLGLRQAQDGQVNTGSNVHPVPSRPAATRSSTRSSATPLTLSASTRSSATRVGSRPAASTRSSATRVGSRPAATRSSATRVGSRPAATRSSATPLTLSSSSSSSATPLTSSSSSSSSATPLTSSSSSSSSATPLTSSSSSSSSATPPVIERVYFDLPIEYDGDLKPKKKLRVMVLKDTGSKMVAEYTTILNSAKDKYTSNSDNRSNIRDTLENEMGKFIAYYRGLFLNAGSEAEVQKAVSAAAMYFDTWVSKNTSPGAVGDNVKPGAPSSEETKYNLSFVIKPSGDKVVVYGLSKEVAEKMDSEYRTIQAAIIEDIKNLFQQNPDDDAIGAEYDRITDKLTALAMAFVDSYKHNMSAKQKEFYALLGEWFDLEFGDAVQNYNDSITLTGETQPAEHSDELQPSEHSDELQPSEHSDELQPAEHSDELQPAEHSEIDKAFEAEVWDKHFKLGFMKLQQLVKQNIKDENLVIDDEYENNLNALVKEYTDAVDGVFEKYNGRVPDVLMKTWRRVCNIKEVYESVLATNNVKNADDILKSFSSNSEQFQQMWGQQSKKNVYTYMNSRYVDTTDTPNRWQKDARQNAYMPHAGRSAVLTKTNARLLMIYSKMRGSARYNTVIGNPPASYLRSSDSRSVISSTLPGFNAMFGLLKQHAALLRQILVADNIVDITITRNRGLDNTHVYQFDLSNKFASTTVTNAERELKGQLFKLEGISSSFEKYTKSLYNVFKVNSPNPAIQFYDKSSDSFVPVSNSMLLLGLACAAHDRKPETRTDIGISRTRQGRSEHDVVIRTLFPGTVTDSAMDYRIRDAINILFSPDLDLNNLETTFGTASDIYSVYSLKNKSIMGEFTRDLYQKGVTGALKIIRDLLAPATFNSYLLGSAFLFGNTVDPSGDATVKETEKSIVQKYKTIAKYLGLKDEDVKDLEEKDIPEEKRYGVTGNSLKKILGDVNSGIKGYTSRSEAIKDAERRIRQYSRGETIDPIIYPFWTPSTGSIYDRINMSFDIADQTDLYYAKSIFNNAITQSVRPSDDETRRKVLFATNIVSLPYLNPFRITMYMKELPFSNIMNYAQTFDNVVGKINEKSSKYLTNPFDVETVSLNAYTEDGIKHIREHVYSNAFTKESFQEILVDFEGGHKMAKMHDGTVNFPNSTVAKNYLTTARFNSRMIRTMYWLCLLRQVMLDQFKQVGAKKPRGPGVVTRGIHNIVLEEEK